MSKSKENNINKIGERLLKNVDLYDGPVMVDNGEIKFEKEVGATDLYKPKRKVQSWDVMTRWINLRLNVENLILIYSKVWEYF
jgi:hypothetical protein